MFHGRIQGGPAFSFAVLNEFSDLATKVRNLFCKSEKVSCKLGKGRAFLFDIESEDGERLRLRAELYPYKGTWLQCRYIGRPKSFKKYEKDYKKIIKSLRLTE